MSRPASERTDEQWAHIAPLLPAPQASPRGGPKPIPNRPVFAGLLWILRSGARWKDLPERDTLRPVRAGDGYVLGKCRRSG